MIGSAELQEAYNKLYVELRKYIWGFDVVNAIADLEVASYTACASLDKVRRSLDAVNMFARPLLKEDEDLKKAFDNFYKLIEDESEVYVKLTQVREVISNEGSKE